MHHIYQKEDSYTKDIILFLILKRAYYQLQTLLFDKLQFKKQKTKWSSTSKASLGALKSLLIPLCFLSSTTFSISYTHSNAI